MNWSPSLIATGIWIVISSFLGLLELLLRYRWKDGRTQKYKIARKYLFVLFILSSIFALALTMYDKTRAEQESLRLAKALREAADDRKKHATAGRIETLTGLSQAFVIGDSGTAFISFRSASLFDALPFPPNDSKNCQTEFCNYWQYIRRKIERIRSDLRSRRSNRGNKRQ